MRAADCRCLENGSTKALRRICPFDFGLSYSGQCLWFKATCASFDGIRAGVRRPRSATVVVIVKGQILVVIRLIKVELSPFGGVVGRVEEV